MKITVTKKDLQKAMKADYINGSRAELCLLAQALRRQCPSLDVKVRYCHASVGADLYRLSKKAVSIIELFDELGSRKYLPNRKAQAALRKMLPCVLVLRKQVANA